MTDAEILDALLGGHPFTSFVYEEHDPENTGVATIRHRLLRSRKDVIEAIQQRKEQELL